VSEDKTTQRLQRKVDLLSTVIANLQGRIDYLGGVIDAQQVQISEKHASLCTVNDEASELMRENKKLREAFKSARLAIPRQCDRKAFDRHLEIAMR
jgi:hypothetical protein